METITAALKSAIRQSDATLYRISKDSGVEYSVLHNFARDRNDIMLVTADKLAGYFGLNLTPNAPAKSRAISKATPKAAPKAATKPAAKAVRRLSL